MSKIVNIIFITLLCSITYISTQFLECHDDPGFDPEDGPLSDLQFTWLGTLQYIHVKNGTPHYFRVPRVLLISRQFVLSTAVDAAQIPEGYALGNVVLAEYERDLSECSLTVDQVANGSECAPATLVTPIADVLLHPEFKHFGAQNSLAVLTLVTPVKSQFVLPVCLPMKNFLTRRSGKVTKNVLFHLDFTTDLPRDFVEDEKYITRVSLLPREVCFLYDHNENRTNLVKNRLACTTGCGFHSGAPSLIHEKTGHWTVVSLALGGSPCPDPLRSRRPPPPARHLMLHPYVPWITSAISGKSIGRFSKDDPFGYTMPRHLSLYDVYGHEWVGHWWMGGIRCQDRGEQSEDLFRFYQEEFQITPIGSTYASYYLELNAAHGANIICVKVGMPYHKGKPKVWGLDSPVAKVYIPVIRFQHTYQLQVESWAYNVTESSSSEAYSSYSYYSDSSEEE